MYIRWEIDDDTVVELEMGAFGKSELRVNGKLVACDLSSRKEGSLRFDLSDGRRAEISVARRAFGSSIVTLRVNGQLMVPTGKEPPKCGACNSAMKPNDRFCGTCGQAAPSPETYQNRKDLRDATTSIWALAGIFFVSGIALFFLVQSQDQHGLDRLAGMSASVMYPTPIGGKFYTVGALRDELLREPWTILIENLLLMGVMVGLAIWSKWAPLAAILIAAATYAVVIVTNAIVNPATLSQGIYIKLIVLLLMYRGIKGALALRPQNG